MTNEILRFQFDIFKMTNESPSFIQFFHINYIVNQGENKQNATERMTNTFGASTEFTPRPKALTSIFALSKR